MSDQSIESAQKENRIFPPPPAISAKAWIKSREQYDQMYRESIDRPEDFWSKIAGELHWFKKWDRVLEWNLPNAKWFVGGKTNLSYNCLDHQIEKGRGEKTAILWEGEPEAAAGKGGEVRRISFEQLRDQVCRFANGLEKAGREEGDARHDLYADGSRGGGGDAGVRRLGGAAQRDLRRIHQPGDRRSGG